MECAHPAQGRTNQSRGKFASIDPQILNLPAWSRLPVTDNPVKLAAVVLLSLCREGPGEAFHEESCR